MKLRPVTLSRSPTYMTRSGSSKGRLRNRKELTTVNTVPFMPMPSASAVAAATVNPRSFAKRRTANRRSWRRLMFGSPLELPDRKHRGERRAYLKGKDQ
jgi:hypothetical protein